MTVSALTRPGERDRLIVKIGEIDWIFCLTLCLIAGAGAVMLFSIAGSSWTPWAAPHLIRFGLFFAIMIVLSLIDLRVWFALAYPIYGIGLLLLVAAGTSGIGMGFSIRARSSGSLRSAVRMISRARGAAAPAPKPPCSTRTLMA